MDFDRNSTDINNYISVNSAKQSAVNGEMPVISQMQSSTHSNNTGVTEVSKTKEYQLWKIDTAPVFSRSEHLVTASRARRTLDSRYYNREFKQHRALTKLKPAAVQPVAYLSSDLPNSNCAPFYKLCGETQEQKCLKPTFFLENSVSAETEDAKDGENNLLDTDCDRCTCPTCGKKFAWLSRLRTHMRVHSLEKPFECHRCGKTFAAKRYLQSHILRHESYDHRIDVTSVSTLSLASPAVTSTGASSSGYSQDSVCKNFVYNVVGAKKFKCAYCDKSYTRRCRLTEHLIKHLPEIRNSASTGADKLSANQPSVPTDTAHADLSTTSSILSNTAEEPEQQQMWLQNVQPAVSPKPTSPMDPKSSDKDKVTKKSSVSTFKVKALQSDAGGSMCLTQSAQLLPSQLFGTNSCARFHFLSNSALLGKPVLSTGFRRQKIGTSANSITAAELQSLAEIAAEKYDDGSATPVSLSATLPVKQENDQKDNCKSVVQHADMKNTARTGRLLLPSHPRKKQSHRAASVTSINGNFQSASLISGAAEGRQVNKAAVKSVIRNDNVVGTSKWSLLSASACLASSNDSRALAKDKTISHDSWEEKKHLCELCFKYFKSASILACHLNSHYGMKPFICNVAFCSRGYCDKRSLRRHMESCHSGQSPGDHVYTQTSASLSPTCNKMLESTQSHIIGNTTTSISAPMFKKFQTGWNLSKRDGFGSADYCQRMLADDMDEGMEEQTVALDLSWKGNSRA